MKFYEIRRYIGFFIIAFYATCIYGNGVEINGVNYVLDSTTKTATVTCCGSSPENNCYSGDIIIPDTVEYDFKKYAVVGVGDAAFRYCINLRSISLPNTIKSLGYRCFDGTGITSFTVPDSVSSIPESCFHNCYSLTKFTMNGLTTNIGDYAFSDCPNIKSVYITDISKWCNIPFGRDVNKYLGYGQRGFVHEYSSTNPLQNGADLFLNGEKVVNLIIPDGVKQISQDCFHGCLSIQTVEISKSVVDIKNGAFESCSNLKSVSIYSDDVHYDECFSGCTNIESLYFYGDCTPSLGLSNCKNLTKVQLSEKMLAYDIDRRYVNGDEAEYFRNSFPYVKEYIVQEGTTHIGAYRFVGCDSLEIIKIPSSVKTIGTDAFEYCGNLKTVK